MISHQAQGYLDGLGDIWLNKNKPDLGKRDLPSQIIEASGLRPTAVLEVGCSNGWLLKRLREKYGCAIIGIDPSKQAIEEAGEPDIFRIGLSTDIPVADNSFDLVIMGYCLWATAPEDWFRTVAEADRVLADQGHLIIHDYVVPRFMRRPYCQTASGATYYQYYYDWQKLWTSHPAYRVKGEMMLPGQHAIICASILKKDNAAAISLDLKG